RNVRRRQRLERRRLVPVQEVAAVTVQFPEGVERLLHAVGQGGQAQVAEVVGHQCRSQQQTHVRRRGAVGDFRSRLFLEIVRRQPIVVGADERLEEAPGLAGGAAQEPALVGPERRGGR